MAKILVTHGIPMAGLAPLDEAGHEVLLPAVLTAFTPAELMALIPEADAVIACGPLDGETIRAGKRLRIIANYGAGYDRVDARAATACGVPLVTIPEVTAGPTAELAVGLMLSVCRRVGEMTVRIRSETPEKLFGLGRYMGTSLAGRRVGILGMGRIGCAVAELLRPFGVTLMCYSRHEPEALHGAQYLPTVEALAESCDILSVHCPLTEETRGLVDRALLRRMPRESILINTARGGVVDYAALCEALERGHLAGAGLDVYPDEPHVPPELIACPTAVLTPHIGTNTVQTREAMARACALNILDALTGQPLCGVVNPGWEAHTRK